MARTPPDPPRDVIIPWPLSSPEHWDDIACRVPTDPVEDFLGNHGRDAFADGGTDDRQMGRALAHAGFATGWKP